MAYTIYKADGTSVSVPDNTIDPQFYNPTSGPGAGPRGLQLVGRNAINYGAPTAQNFLQLAENFCGNLPPGDPDNQLQGQLWFDKANLTLKVNISANIAAADWRSIVTTDSSGVIPNRGGSVPAVNPTSGLEEDGDIRVVGSVISIWANGAWRQVFPAVYA